jgi:hypothetical protein
MEENIIIFMFLSAKTGQKGSLHNPRHNRPIITASFQLSA